MKRVIVVGGQGLFGRTVVEQLNCLGITSRVAGRHHGADIPCDANNIASIQSVLKPGDLIIDTAGPFQRRSLALIEAAVATGFDLIDINDNLRYAEQVLQLEDKINSSGIRLLSSASSVSALAAAMVSRSQILDPVRVTSFLAPATRHTANSGSALSLIKSVGAPVRAWREGQWQTLVGWSERRRFPMPSPLGTISGRLFESADAIYLPRIWPSLKQVSMFVDANTPGVNMLLCVAARFPALRGWIAQRMKLAARLSRMIGSETGGIGYEIEDAAGKMVRVAALSARNSFIIAVAPAVLAARAIVAGRFLPTGLVLPHHQVDPDELDSFLMSAGIQIVRF